MAWYCPRVTSKEDSARYYLKHKSRIRLAAQHRRRANVAKAVLEDSRRTDKRAGRPNDLDLAFVQEALAHPCRYCGCADLRMTLDRQDNAGGHTRVNVVPACERCSIIRRGMPLEAWLVVSEAVTEAYQRGLFGEWTGALHRRPALDPLPEPKTHPLIHGTLAGYMKCGPVRCAECKVAMRDGQRDRRKKKNGV
jgi:hypothetical protein